MAMIETICFYRYLYGFLISFNARTFTAIGTLSHHIITCFSAYTQNTYAVYRCKLLDIEWIKKYQKRGEGLCGYFYEFKFCVLFSDRTIEHSIMACVQNHHQ